MVGFCPSNQSTRRHSEKRLNRFNKHQVLVASCDEIMDPAPRATHAVCHHHRRTRLEGVAGSSCWDPPPPLTGPPCDSTTLLASTQYPCALRKCSHTITALAAIKPARGRFVYKESGRTTNTTCSIQLGKTTKVFSGHSVIHKESPVAQPVI